jgi:hypothetical protein
VSESNRNIFEYQSGGKTVFADPLQVIRALHGAMAGEIHKWLSRTDPKTTDSTLVVQAWNKLIPATRQAFRLMPFNPETGHGTTDADAIGVLKSFLAWRSKKKVKSASSPTSSASTAPTS